MFKIDKKKLSLFISNHKIDEFRPLFEQNTKLKRKKSSILDTCLKGQTIRSSNNLIARVKLLNAWKSNSSSYRSYPGSI